MNAKFLTNALKEAQGLGIGARLLGDFEEAFENIVIQGGSVQVIADKIQDLLGEAHQIDAQAPIAIIWKAVLDRAVDWAVETQPSENLGIFLNRLVEQNPDQAGVILGRVSQAADNSGEDIKSAVHNVSLHNEKRINGEEGAGYEAPFNDFAITQP
ncbi:MAG: hypothetical protein KDJ75_01755 [Alphaproteobacteria bacterium]|nr:hypothetical protein [Alphaproteobacteria bacterium]